MIDYGLADFEARYAAGMIGAAADQGTQSAPKEETHRQRKQREREAERNPGSTARRTLALSKNVIPSVSCKLRDKYQTEPLKFKRPVQNEHMYTFLVLSGALSGTVSEQPSADCRFRYWSAPGGMLGGGREMCTTCCLTCAAMWMGVCGPPQTKQMFCCSCPLCTMSLVSLPSICKALCFCTICTVSYPPAKT